MAVPSNNPVRIPHRAQQGQPIKASQYNELVDAVRALTQRGIPSPAVVAQTPELLPFEISVTADSLRAEPGTLDGDAIAETTESSPANGTWYLEAKVTINASTGVVTATAMQWTATTPSSATTTNFYQVIGEVDVVAGVPDASSIVQYDYGPLIVVQFGDVSDKWGVLIF